MSLAQDSHLEIIPLMWEDPHSYTMSYDVEKYDSGHVRGDLDMPADREREVFHFKGISSTNSVYPTPGIKTLLDYYLCGGQIRVYRMYPANLSAWDAETNETGYSDIIEKEVNGGSYPWYNVGMTIFSFDLDGVAVR